MREVIYEFALGDIYSVAKEAVAFARKHVNRDTLPVRVSFIFNDIEVIGYSSSEPLDLVSKYMLQSKIRRLELGTKD